MNLGKKAPSAASPLAAVAIGDGNPTRRARRRGRTDAAETVDGDLDLSLGDGVDGGSLWNEGAIGSALVRDDGRRETRAGSVAGW